MPARSRSARPAPPEVSREQVLRLWFRRQGLAAPRGTERLTRRTFRDLLRETGGLQLDSVNVLDRAHYLTLWTRFGQYDRRQVDRWAYRDRVAYEYWGHEACLLPIEHLPISRRRMAAFPPPHWLRSSWWPRYQTSPGSKRRVLRRLREEGVLESANFAVTAADRRRNGQNKVAMPMFKEDNRSLQLLWHAGRIAIANRRHFRRHFDLAERVYPDGPTVSTAACEDSWLLAGLRGNGIASEKHLVNYFTAPYLTAADRRRVLARNLRSGRVVEVRVPGVAGACYALPEHLEGLDSLPSPRGTTPLCPFDSFLWQRGRAEELLDFRYRVEIYVPPPKRTFGYYVMPILHDGRLVGRLDPKLHRDRACLEIKSLHLEPDFRRTRRFDAALEASLHDLATFVGAERVTLPARSRQVSRTARR